MASTTAETKPTQHLDLVLAQVQENLSDLSLKGGAKDRYAAVVLNTVVIFQAGFEQGVRDTILEGLLSAASSAATKTEVDAWEKSITGSESSWIAGHFTAEPTPLATIPGTPIVRTVKKYLLEHLNPKQASDLKATFDALQLSVNDVPHKLLNAAAIRSKDTFGAVSAANFIVSILTTTPGGRVILNAWRFTYDLKRADVLAGHETAIAGLSVVPLELEIDPAKYAQAEVEDDLKDLIKVVQLPNAGALIVPNASEKDEYDELAKWADSSITPDGHVILLSTSGAPGEYPFDVSLFGVLRISGNVNILKQSIEVNAGISIPFIGKVNLGSIKGDLKQGVTLGVDVWVAKGSLRFFVEGGYFKVQVDLQTKVGNWNKTVSLFPLPF